MFKNLRSVRNINCLSFKLVQKNFILIPIVKKNFNKIEALKKGNSDLI